MSISLSKPVSYGNIYFVNIINHLRTARFLCKYLKYNKKLFSKKIITLINHCYAKAITKVPLEIYLNHPKEQYCAV